MATIENIFNAAQYFEMYPALLDEQYGLNEENVYEAHFVKYGAGELRAPNAELYGKVYMDSIVAYANGNPELAEEFDIEVPVAELDFQQRADLLLHYVLYGHAEDRADKLIDAEFREPETGGDTDLEAALNVYVAAVEAKEANLKDAAEKSEAVKAQLAADPDLSNQQALDNAVEEAAGEVASKDNINLDAFTSDNTTDAARESMITGARAQLEAAVNDAQADVDDVKGLSKAAGKLGSAQSAYETAVKTAANNFAAFKGAQTAFETANGLASGDASVTDAKNPTDFLLTVESLTGITSNSGEVDFVIENNRLVQETTLTAAEQKILDKSGVADLVAAAQAMYNNIALLSNAETALNNATLAVLNAEQPDLFLTGSTTTADSKPVPYEAGNALFFHNGDLVYGKNAATGVVVVDAEDSGSDVTNATFYNIADILTGTADADADAGQVQVGGAETTASTYKLLVGTALADLAPKSTALSKAAKDLADFNTAVKEYNDVNKYAKADTANDEAIADAKKAIKDLDYNLVDETTGDVYGTEENDLFVFAGETLTVHDFGDEGDDTMFFGTKYTFVKLSNEDAVADRVGDQNTLEIFAQQEGTSVVLYVEKYDYAGNATVDTDLVKVELTGVTLAELEFNQADGFLNFVA